MVGIVMFSLRGGLCGVAGLWIATLVVASAEADQARTLQWEDLLPEALYDAEVRAVALQERMNQLAPEVKEAYWRVANERLVRDKLASGLITEEELSDRDRQLLADKPGEVNPDAVAFWDEVDSTRDEMEGLDGVVDDRNNGHLVRIPGYALPLEFEGTAVSEFLLVPYVGACIHSPPPPLNQIVFIKVSEPFASKGLFTPVWVEGVLNATLGTHELSLVDGRAPIDVGYRIEGAVVAPYEEEF